MNIGVGTPSRIVDLITEGRNLGPAWLPSSLTPSLGALACESLQRVVIDCSFLDQKQRSIFDLRETQQPLMQLLNRKELKDRYSGSHVPVKLIFY